MKPTDSSGRVKDGAEAVLTATGLGVGFFPEPDRRLEVVAGVPAKVLSTRNPDALQYRPKYRPLFY